MTEKQIQEIIKNYNSLVELVKHKVSIMELIHTKYCISRGIERVSFSEGEVVEVVYDDSFRGFDSFGSFCFPLLYLSLSDDELKSVVQTQRDIELKNKELEEEEKRKQRIQDQETKEREQLKKLQEKYGKSI